MNTTETQPPDSLGAATGSAFPALETDVLEYLDALEEKERVERIDDLLHRLSFERRLTLLAPNQREAMNDRTLHSTQRAGLDACKTEAERDKLIGEMARTQYFRRCAWSDYLNGVRAEPPVMPNASEEPMSLQSRIELLEKKGYRLDFCVGGNNVYWVAETPDAHDSGMKPTLEDALSWAEKDVMENNPPNASRSEMRIGAATEEEARASWNATEVEQQPWREARIED